MKMNNVHNVPIINFTIKKQNFVKSKKLNVNKWTMIIAFYVIRNTTYLKINVLKLKNQSTVAFIMIQNKNVFNVTKVISLLKEYVIKWTL